MWIKLRGPLKRGFQERQGVFLFNGARLTGIETPDLIGRSLRLALLRWRAIIDHSSLTFLIDDFAAI